MDGPVDTVTVVIPAYDEAPALRAGNLGRVLGWARSSMPPAEVLLVDDGSSDGTGALAEELGATVLRTPHCGKGAAIRAGIERASGDWVLLTDMDLATPIEEAPKLLAALGEGADVTLGDRGFRRAGAPTSRRLMSLGHWALRRLLLGIPWRDTQCGFKALRRRAALEVLRRMAVYGSSRAPGRATGHDVSSGFDVEFLVVARCLGLDVRTIPVSWHHAGGRRLHAWRASWEGLSDVRAIASARRRGLYEGRNAPPSR